MKSGMVWAFFVAGTNPSEYFAPQTARECARKGVIPLRFEAVHSNAQFLNWAKSVKWYHGVNGAN
jgi:hypothetical protein